MRTHLIKDKNLRQSGQQSIEELIRRRRLQLLVHSAIYYQFNSNLISDLQWSQWAKELVDLQNQYPDIANTTVYANAFKDFDPSTGYNLPFSNPEIQTVAIRLLNYHLMMDKED